MTWLRDDDDRPTFKYSDERRHDPVLLEKVGKVLDAQEQAFHEAAELVRQAVEIMQKASGFEDSAIYERSYDAVHSAQYKLKRDSRSMGIKNDNYKQNMAAGRMGLQIEKMGDKFPF